MKKIILLLISLTLLSCSDSDKSNALTKTTDDIHFTNEAFELSITKPDGWYSQDVKELIALQESGREFIDNDDANFQAALEESLNNSVPLFGFHEFKPGTKSITHASIIGIAENISKFPEITNACEYLNASKNTLSQSKFQIHIEKECHTSQINESELSHFNAQILANDFIIQQTYLSCLSDGYAVNIIATSTNKQGALQLDEVLSSLSLKCDR